MAEEWVMVRVRRSTHARLMELGRRLTVAVELGHADAWWRGERVSHDDIVAKLLAREERHRQRRRR